MSIIKPVFMTFTDIKWVLQIDNWLCRAIFTDDFSIIVNYFSQNRTLPSQKL